MQADYDEQCLQLRLVDEKFVRSTQELKRLEEDLVYERQNCSNEESARKILEMKLGELQTKLDNSNNIMSAANRKMLEKLESKLRGLEDELDQERRKSKDHLKHLRQAERNVKDLEYQSFQDKRNSERFEVSFFFS